jgi:hypothetical protein
MSAPGRFPCTAAAALLVLAWVAPARAIETDQYYAWDREMEDSTETVNAKVNSEILLVLDEVNAKPSWPALDCFRVAKRIHDHFRLFIYHDLELWADNTSLIDRVPATAEEESLFRRRCIYYSRNPFDVGTWMPPSPTIEVAGVRIGTDKLTHFFSEGWMSYGWFRGGLDKGLSPEAAELRAIDRGVLLERSILGMAASGVFSPADMEANYQGMLFFRDLCDTERPALRKGDRGWRLERPFDLRDHVTPEWDESWQTNVYTKRRWKKVEPVIRSYCPLLEHPAVKRRRAAYAERDRETVTEGRILELVGKGKLADPRSFSIEHLCTEGAGAEEPRPGEDSAGPPLEQR